MSQYFETATRPDTAAGAIGQHLRVKTTGALVLAGASDVSIGTMENPCVAAGPCTVRLASAQGTRKMIAAGAFDADAVLYAAANGTVDDSGTVIEGRAMHASGGAGDVVEVMSLGANVLDAGTVTETGTQTLTNKTLTAPTMTAPVLGVATGTSLVTTGTIASTGTAGIGYATGAGGTVSQDTDRTTGVTINKITGAITTQATSLAAGATVQFTVTNSTVAVGDTVVVSVRSGPTNTSTSAHVVTVAAGSFKIALVNNHASVADTGAAIINFAVIKAVSA
jgi:hypothetical protein